MKKFILYILLIALIAGILTIVYGFVNAKLMRNYARDITTIKADFLRESSQEDIIPLSDDTIAGVRDITELKERNTALSDHFEKVMNEAQKAQKRTESLWAPASFNHSRQEYLSSYSTIKDRVSGIRAGLSFISQILDISAMLELLQKPGTSLEDVKQYTEEAYESTNALDISGLPPEIASSAQELQAALEEYIGEMKNTAENMLTENSQLNEKYNIYTEKEKAFIESSQEYFRGFDEEIGKLEAINEQAQGYNEIYFRLK